MPQNSEELKALIAEVETESNARDDIRQIEPRTAAIFQIL